MKTGVIYYLKKYHKPFITSKPTNSKAIIEDIVDDIVYGHYVDDPNTNFSCMRCEFSKLFSSKPDFKHEFNKIKSLGKKGKNLHNKIIILLMEENKYNNVNCFERGEKVFLKSNPEHPMTVHSINEKTITTIWYNIYNEMQLCEFPPECILQYKYAALKTYRKKLCVSLN